MGRGLLKAGVDQRQLALQVRDQSRREHRRTGGIQVKAITVEFSAERSGWDGPQCRHADRLRCAQEAGRAVWYLEKRREQEHQASVVRVRQCLDALQAFAHNLLDFVVDERRRIDLTREAHELPEVWDKVTEHEIPD